MFDDDIRPFSDDEVAGVVHNLVRNRSFLDFIAKWLLPGLYGWVPSLARLGVSVYFRYHLGRVSSIREFQQGVSHVARKIVDETTDGFTFEGIENLDPNENYIFISNHRDIAGDSMLLDYGLYLNDRDTVRIAVGDNLVQIGFATDLMKLNKSFFIKRSAEGAKKIYAALLQSSQYIHHSLHTGHSIWIAQSEGRAKDGMDRTDPAIIKMFALADRKADFDALIASLHIVPMAISYEFDPCDVSKAIELQAIATDGNYVKPEGADLANLARPPSLQRALMGQKRRALHEEYRKGRKPDVRHRVARIAATPLVRKGRAGLPQHRNQIIKNAHPHLESEINRFA